jgi:hypothetical protein
VTGRLIVEESNGFPDLRTATAVHPGTPPLRHFPGRLERILASFEARGELGGAASFDRDYLRASLQGASRQTTFAFWAALLTQTAVFVITGWFVVEYSSHPSVLRSILAGGGGCLAATGYGIVRLWKEKVTTDLTLALIGSMNESAARAALHVVLENLRDRGSPPKRVRASQTPGKPSQQDSMDPREGNDA